MKNLPKLILRVDREGELNLFLEFFNHPHHKQHRNMILRAFPMIEALIRDSGSEVKP